ncbi:CMRF35-like molecule 7 isoform X2 [Festucalex cinctus]
MQVITACSSPLLFIFWLPKHSADPDQLKAPKVVRAAYGESLIVPCHYDPQFRNSTKYWCRGPIYELCKIIAKTPKQRKNDRCSIADDKEAGVVTVTMTALRRRDADMYWCVVARPGRNIFTGVKIIVSNAVISPTSAVPETTSETNKDKTRWWEALRWIIFLSLVFSVVVVHIVAWKLKAARKVWHRNVSEKTANIYG